MSRKTAFAITIALVLSAGALSSANAGTLVHGTLPTSAGTLKPPSGGGSGRPVRQPVDPPPYLGGSYGGDSAGGDGGGGGYLGDPNYPGLHQF